MVKDGLRDALLRVQLVKYIAVKSLQFYMVRAEMEKYIHKSRQNQCAWREFQRQNGSYGWGKVKGTSSEKWVLCWAGKE